MLEENKFSLIGQEAQYREKTGWEKIFGASVLALSVDKYSETVPEKTFEYLLEQRLEPNMSLQEMSVCIVESALEIEFGEEARYSIDFAKMIGVLADALSSNQELRKQMFAVSNTIVRRKLSHTKKVVH